MKPLQGIRVLDPTHVLAGPFCTYQLGLMGAEIIRVDAVGDRDFIRSGSLDEQLRNAGMSESFLMQNAGKKSIALDLKDERGRDLFRRLARGADVVVENYRPGTYERLGLGYEDLRRDNPGLVYCSLTGFGQQGPLRDMPAYDHLVQALSGMMSLMGTEESGPMRVGFPIIDYIVGLMAAFAIASALHRRTVSGEGSYLDVAMLDSALAMMGPVLGGWLISGRLPPKGRNRAFSGSPYSGLFETADGTLALAANTRAQAIQVLEVIGLGERKDDPALTDWRGSGDEGAEAHALLTAALKTDSALNWEARLSAAGVPAGMLRNVPEILDHPQIAARELLHRIDAVPGLDRDITVPGVGFRVDDHSPVPAGPPPRKGADTRTVLHGLGLDAADMDALEEDGVILSAS